ncbi:MAG: DNA adenine methylase, partial [Clostridia bacterium]|nr:DNA adenine methylase [Clostridia bacterium]
MVSRLRPLLKYPGGKTSELDIIFEHLPQYINNYIEPFVGGGAVYFALSNENMNYINDKSEELMLLYEYIKTDRKAFFDELTSIIENWDKLTELANDVRLMDLYLRFRENEDLEISSDLSLIINEKIDDIPMFNLRNNVKFEKYLSECLLRRINLIKKNEIKKERKL